MDMLETKHLGMKGYIVRMVGHCSKREHSLNTYESDGSVS